MAGATGKPSYRQLIIHGTLTRIRAVRPQSKMGDARHCAAELFSIWEPSSEHRCPSNPVAIRYDSCHAHTANLLTGLGQAKPCRVHRKGRLSLLLWKQPGLRVLGSGMLEYLSSELRFSGHKSHLTRVWSCLSPKGRALHPRQKVGKRSPHSLRLKRNS